MESVEYGQAVKLGEKAYRHAVARGEYPYLPALDDILSCVEVQREEKLGLVDIPLDQIVGTKTSGRQNAFAVNFMPLMKSTTEFADKWIRLYKYQTEQGNSDPIKVYEFMNRFYVQEGNKRVSVFKYLNASSIEGEVIRVVPKKNDTLENKLYYEFMDFYNSTKINYIWFTKEGRFASFLKAMGKKPEEIWTKEERDEFSSTFFRFQKRFLEKGGDRMQITAADAFLFFLSVYPYDTLSKMTEKELRAGVDRVWNEFAVLEESPQDALVMERVESGEVRIINKLLSISGVGNKKVKVAFLHDRSVEKSSWTYSHELGRTHLEEVFADSISTKSYFLEDSGIDAEALLEQAIKDGNNIIFTANQKFLSASLKKALEYPHVKILNCSINRSFHAIRTYYGRMYEAKFLCGMVAGAMTPNDKILYCADYPIYGAFANINAFALGAKMVNPKASVYVHWLCDTTSNLEAMMKEHDISIVSYTDMIRLSSQNRKYGLYMTKGEEIINLAMPVWNWGRFYEKIVGDIQEGNWNKGADVKNRRAINYWWGISSEIIDLIISGNVPSGLQTLIKVMRKEIFTENFNPFQGEITLQDATVIGDKNAALTPEQIIKMDWYVENVVGELPRLENLTEDAKMLISQQEGSVTSKEKEK